MMKVSAETFKFGLCQSYLHRFWYIYNLEEVQHTPLKSLDLFVQTACSNRLKSHFEATQENKSHHEPP